MAAHVAFSAGFVLDITSIHTVPVKVPVACRVDGADDAVAAVEFLTMFEGILDRWRVR